MSFIGEAALSVFFEMLFKKLANSELLNVATDAKALGEIKKWEKKLRMLRLVLDDAEEKMIQSRAVKEWLGDLKHLVYDVEDVLDEFSTECLRRKVMREPQAASTSKIRKLIPSCCTTFTPRVVTFNYDMNSKIKEITFRFNDILEVMKELDLMPNVRTTSTKVWQRPPSSYVPDEPTVYGRDDDKKKILDLLVRNETSDVPIGVIPIVGMGGMGKTTLVYNDDSILQSHFQLKGWVCVSDVFDIKNVSQGILDSITSQSSDLKDLSQVQSQLKKQLEGKRFLLVLDDVWTNNYDDWHTLRSPLLGGAPGSKIIVTTRNADVATMMGTVENYDLKRISDDDCWLLFKHHAFQNTRSVAHLEMEKIGREIVNKRCGGLPLAARTLGGLLRSKRRIQEWEEVLNNEMWNKLEGNSDMPRALYLSYHYLPSHLKRCFAYCAIFPKDYEFTPEQLILLWMAEGLIPQEGEKREMEELGKDCFDELLSRCIFQASTLDKSLYIMHDFVSDLAREAAGDVCLRLDDEVHVGEISKGEKIRYCSYIQNRYNRSKRFAPFYNMKFLRSFLSLSGEFFLSCYLASFVPGELVKHLKLLRVLSFSNFNIKLLPDSIGDLKHLRFLDLSNTEIEVLPESVTSLYNLQTLILKGCRQLRSLPARMDNLINLRHLDIVGVYLVEGMPLEIKQLNGLRTLSKAIIGKESFTIAGLMNLNSLQGELSIQNLDNVVDGSDALNARMNDKEGLHALELNWKYTNTDVDEVQYRVLDALRPHKNLKKLVVKHYGGARFPPWMVNSTHINIVYLELKSCKNCTSLPQLGMLQNLKVLIINNMSTLQKVDSDFYGDNPTNSFPCLEVLEFDKLRDWEEWVVCEFEFRALRELRIARCGNLKASLPSLPKLAELEIYKCEEVIFSCKDNFCCLTRLELNDIASITIPTDRFPQRLKKFKQMTIAESGMPMTKALMGSNLECEFGGCPQLLSMVIDKEKEHLQMELAESETESLTLLGNYGLKKVPAWIEKLKFLKKLCIIGCESLATIPQGTAYRSWYLEILVIESCYSMISIGRRHLPPTLKKLLIHDCKNLKKLFEEDEKYSYSTNFEHLEIWDCRKLTSISFKGELPDTLKCLVIIHCPILTSVGKLPFRLRSLKIQQCYKVKSIAESFEKLPSGLQSLTIELCGKIGSIAESFDYNTSLDSLTVFGCSSLKSLPEGLYNLIHLRYLKIQSCPCIVSFPIGGFPSTNLTELYIINLKRLEALPENLHRVSSLQELVIENCPNLVSFPTEGLPINLTTFYIENLKICESLFRWGLEHLQSLKSLRILGGCEEMISFPSDEIGMVLPPSLTQLSIGVFPELQYLSTRGFLNLTCLEELYIKHCPKLASFPENGLPDSMKKLDLDNCPILVPRCEDGKGPEWSKIRHIPYVHIW